MLGATVRTCEQRILSVEGDGADRSLDGVVVELDAAVVDEACQPFPAREGVADGLGKPRTAVSHHPRDMLRSIVAPNRAQA